MTSKVINSSNKLAFTRVILSKSMLLLTEYIMCVKMLEYVTVYDVLKYFTWDTC